MQELPVIALLQVDRPHRGIAVPIPDSRMQHVASCDHHTATLRVEVDPTMLGAASVDDGSSPVRWEVAQQPCPLPDGHVTRHRAPDRRVDGSILLALVE